MTGYVLCGAFLVVAYLWHLNEKAHEIELKESFREGYKKGLYENVIKMSSEED